MRKKTERPKLTIMLSVRVTEAQARRLTALADADTRRQSDMLRMVVESGLQAYERGTR